ncbi:hypothetical protein [Rhizobium herbae]|uniref:Holin n=1 Tax=Rhizobium herbae TaxID=508661 RepID=A0ABS4EG42_9HYPH|nr:hypothetical protein [Rhizobium herbae]MBP1856912.1 hypothetical protein [Rhizobium herbae]
MSKISEVHDALVYQIVPLILTGPLEVGGDVADVMTVLTSVVVGIVAVCANFGADETAVDFMVAEVRRRLAEQRLGKPEGTA